MSEPKHFKRHYTSFERLPNELLIEIFTYLNGVDTVYAFSQLNTRFQSLLINYVNVFDFKSISKAKFDYVIKHHDIHQWQSLRLSDDDQTPGQIRLFCQRYPLLQYISQLRSLCALNMTPKYAQEFLLQLKISPDHSGGSRILEGGGHFFSKGGAVVRKKYFLGSIRGSISSFSVRFCRRKSKNFSRRGGDRPQRLPLNPPLPDHHLSLDIENIFEENIHSFNDPVPLNIENICGANIQSFDYLVSLEIGNICGENIQAFELPSLKRLVVTGCKHTAWMMVSEKIRNDLNGINNDLILEFSLFGKSRIYCRIQLSSQLCSIST